MLYGRGHGFGCSMSTFLVLNLAQMTWVVFHALFSDITFTKGIPWLRYVAIKMFTLLVQYFNEKTLF